MRCNDGLSYKYVQNNSIFPAGKETVHKHDQFFTNTEINTFSDNQIRLNCVKC